MEYNFTPLPKPETTKSDDKDSDKSSSSTKKSSIGKLAITPKSQEKPSSEAKDSGFSLFKKPEKAPGKTEAEAPPQPEKAETAAARLPELPDDLPPERLGELDETESQLVRQEAVEERRSAEQQLAAPETTVAELAGEQAVEALRDKIALENKAPEAAAAETLAEVPAIVGQLMAEASEPAAAEPVRAGAETIIDTSSPNEGELSLAAPPIETATDDDPAAATSTAAPQAAAGNAGGAGAVPPRGPGGGPGGGFMPPFGPAGPGNFNLNPTAAAPNLPPVDPNMISIDAANYYIRQGEARGLLVGGVLGYFIGRRRGRIKTEKRLLPVQKKLEKQVQGLKAEVADREVAVRQAAIREARAQDSRTAERIIVRPPRPEPRPGNPELRRPAALAAEALHLKKMPPERIGHVLIAGPAERPAPRIRQPEVSKAGPAARAPGELDPDQQVEVMSRNELLTLSERVAIDGATLRQVYETHLVGERGLRRLMTEYLRGGDIKRQLRRELVEREIDFERDPILRDRARASLTHGGHGALESLLIKAGAVATEAEVAEQQSAEKVRAKQEAAAAAKQKRRRRAADISLIGTIVVLGLLVVLLLLTRS
jgi:hypothetical protein